MVKDIVTCVVPEDWLPEGEPAERTGAVESEVIVTVPLKLLEIFSAASFAQA